jgi:phosphoribosylformylglycinamidine synthase
VTTFAVDVVVSLRPVVNDPQGLSVRAGLRSLGFEGVVSARVGKFISLQVEAADEDAAREAVGEMCRKLLCNPVIEDWRIDALHELSPVGRPATGPALPPSREGESPRSQAGG